MVKLELIWYDESVKITDYRKKNYEADLRFFWLIKKVGPVHIISLEWFITWTLYGQKIEGKYFWWQILWRLLFNDILCQMKFLTLEFLTEELKRDRSGILE